MPEIKPDRSDQAIEGDSSVWKNDSEFRDSYLIIPREESESNDQEATYSSAIALRSTLEKRPTLKRKRRPAQVLKKIGLVDVKSMSRLEHTSASSRDKTCPGIFTNQTSLGLAAAYFSNEQEEREARTRLQDQFEFIPNFPLSIPCRVRLDDAAETRAKTPRANSQWPEASGIADAHREEIRGAGVLVGVLDTGVDADHHEFSGRSITFRRVPVMPKEMPGRDVRGFDPEGHGTHVCGILAGKTCGVAPDVTLSVASVIDSETTRTSLVRVSYGIDWIIRQFTHSPGDREKPAVLNMSLGFCPNPPDLKVDEFESWIRVIRTLMRTLVKANVLPIVAIGNEGAGQFRYPGVMPEVIGVGAVDFEHQLAKFSGSAGPPDHPVKPDVVGYGVSVYSSTERDYEGQSFYERWNGTSMATPYVAGIAALYRCRHPRWSVDQIRDCLLKHTFKPAALPTGLARFVK